MIEYLIKCKKCGASLRSDNKLGFCRKHRSLSSATVAYKKEYYSINKTEINKEKLQKYYNNKPKLENRTCKLCCTEFQPIRIDKIFCSNTCGMAYWRSNNKAYIKQDQSKRYSEDINRKISTCLRSRLNKALKCNVKSKSTVELLGCSIEELVRHLESQFEPWMNWTNYGNFNYSRQTWQIDHIVPLKSFDLSKTEEQHKACHYSNLRPLLAKNNLMKGAKHE